MTRPILVHLLPALVEPQALRDGVAVVIDVLRATTTIVHALAHGAAAVIPCGEIDEARRLAAESPPGTALLAGERSGLPIPGFDLGNSPAEFSPKSVQGRRIVMTTTNGTRALIAAKPARRVLVGALSNLGAVVERLGEESGPVHLICAGTDGRITLEDALCAGGIARWLHLSGEDMDAGDDSTQLAVNLYETCGRDYDRACDLLRASRGGRNLIDCGLDSDIADCADQDRFDIVPELHLGAWEIRSGQTTNDE